MKVPLPLFLILSALASKAAVKALAMDRSWGPSARYKATSAAPVATSDAWDPSVTTAANLDSAAPVATSDAWDPSVTTAANLDSAAPVATSDAWDPSLTVPANLDSAAPVATSAAPVAAMVAGDPAALKRELRELLDQRQPSQLNVYQLVESLIEKQSRPIDKALFVGSWELLFSDDDKTRASPFFWAFKKAFGKSTASKVFAVTDAIPSTIKKIGTAKQFVDPTGSLVSQVEIMSPIGQSLMTTSSRWSWSPACDDMLEIRVEKTQVLESTVQRILRLPAPFGAFPSGAALELVSPGSSTVSLQNLYLDCDLRVSRNPLDDKIFIWTRLDEAERPRGQ